MRNRMVVSVLVTGLLIIYGCSGPADTSRFNAEEHYNYAFKLYNEGDYELAVSEFQNFLLQYSGSAFNDDAQFYLGMTYYNKGQFLLGAYEFSKLIRNIPASPFVPESQYMLAESYYQLSPPYQLDQAYTKKAIEEFQAFIDFFPANAKVAEAENKIKTLNDKLAEKDYMSAVIYEKMEYERAAIKSYAAVADTYHDTRFAPVSLYKKIQIEIKKGMKSEALSDLNLFFSRYPNDSNVNELKELESKLMGSK